MCLPKFSNFSTLFCLCPICLLSCFNFSPAAQFVYHVLPFAPFVSHMLLFDQFVFCCCTLPQLSSFQLYFAPFVFLTAVSCQHLSPLAVHCYICLHPTAHCPICVPRCPMHVNGAETANFILYAESLMADDNWIL